MSSNTPEGDKTNMINEKKKKKGKKGNQGNQEVSDSSSSSVVSFDSVQNFKTLPYDVDFDDAANFTMLQKKFQQYFDQQLFIIKTEFQGKIEVLHEVIKNKDEMIGNLNKEIGELKKSCDYLTEETCVLGGKIKANEISIQSGNRKHEMLVNKATDLEDRSRRNNLVFYNIPEEPRRPREDTEREECESKIMNLLMYRGFFDADYTLEIDRAHRLGPKKTDTDTRPRPIIVRFSFFKDKETILQKGRLWKGCEVSVSQDFSKATLDVHKQLRVHAKDAQSKLDGDENQTKSIMRYKVTYRRVSLTYCSNKNVPSAPTFTRSYTLDFIQQNRNWFIPPMQTRNTYSQVQNRNPTQ